MKRTAQIMLYTIVVGVLVFLFLQYLIHADPEMSTIDDGFVLYIIATVIAIALSFGLEGIKPKIVTLLLLVVASLPSLPFTIAFFGAYDLFERYNIPEVYTFAQSYTSCIAYLLILEFQYGRTLHQSRNANPSPRTRKKATSVCHSCGAAMLPEDVFCAHCQTMVPNVQQMLDKYPQKKPEDYLVQTKSKQRCPHCNGVYSKRVGGTGGLNLHTPIICCRHCREYFLDELYNEWSVAGRRYRMIKIFFEPLGVSSILYFGGWLIAVSKWYFIGLFLALYIIACLIWYNIATTAAIQESQLRLERNPEYPLILAKMGYIEVMDQKYHYLLNYKPTRLSDFLKDAFTFE